MKTNLYEIQTGFFSKPQIRRILTVARKLFPRSRFFSSEGSIRLLFPEPISAPEFMDEALGLCRLHEFTYIGDPNLTYVCESCQVQQEEWTELYVPTLPTLDSELDELTLDDRDFLMGEVAQLGFVADRGSW